MVDRAKAEAIVEDIQQGLSLRAAAAKQQIMASTFLLWCRKDDDLKKQYAHAKAISLDVMADQLIEIADDCDDAIKGRLRVDTRKWYMGKLAPKIYGDKLAVTGGGDDDPPLRMEHSLGGEAAALVAQLLKGIKADGE